MGDPGREDGQGSGGSSGLPQIRLCFLLCAGDSAERPPEGKAPDTATTEHFFYGKEYIYIYISAGGTKAQ